MTARKHDTGHLRALRLRWLDGESIEALAAELGTSKSRLVSLWTTRGLTAELPKRRSYRISVAALRRIHARWCAGESIVSLAEEMDMPCSTLAAMLKRAGLSLQRPAGLPQLGGDFNQERRQRRRKWYQWASQQVRQGATWGSVHSALVAQGYPAGKRTLMRAVHAWEAKVYRRSA